MTTKLRARFDGRVLVPLGPVDLPINHDLDLDVEVHGSRSASKGTPQELRRLMREPPHVPSADVEELERLIEQSRRPVQYVAG
jgi:hypothetical protein